MRDDNLRIKAFRNKYKLNSTLDIFMSEVGAKNHARWFSKAVVRRKGKDWAVSLFDYHGSFAAEKCPRKVCCSLCLHYNQAGIFFFCHKQYGFYYFARDHSPATLHVWIFTC